MMNAVQIFNYKNNQVRTIERNGQVWFVAKDVCDILGIVNVQNAIDLLDDDEKMTLNKRGGAKLINIISESGVYALIFLSNKPKKSFARWIRKVIAQRDEKQEILEEIKQGLFEVDLQTRALKITPKGLYRLALEDFAEENHESINNKRF